MKILFDTSILIAALVESHPRHGRAFPWLKKAGTKGFEMVVAGHTLAELYAVLTTLPIKPRIVPSVAWRLIRENVETTGRIVCLTPVEYWTVIKKASESGLVGGIIYDALIAGVAQKAKVEQLLTLNGEHFKQVWPAGESKIITP